MKATDFFLKFAGHLRFHLPSSLRSQAYGLLVLSVTISFTIRILSAGLLAW